MLSIISSFSLEFHRGYQQLGTISIVVFKVVSIQCFHIKMSEYSLRIKIKLIVGFAQRLFIVKESNLYFMWEGYLFICFRIRWYMKNGKNKFMSLLLLLFSALSKNISEQKLFSQEVAKVELDFSIKYWVW